MVFRGSDLLPDGTGGLLRWDTTCYHGDKCLSGETTVITNLVSAHSFRLGPPIVEWLWGGFSVDNATLNRFFSLHYLMPFALAGLVIAHLVLSAPGRKQQPTWSRLDGG